MPTVLPLLALALLTSPAAPRQDAAYSLVPKYAVGETRTYDVVVDGNVAGTTIKTSLVSAEKIVAVAPDGAYTAETTVTPGPTLVNGEEQAGGPTDTKTVTSKYDARGLLLSTDPDDESDATGVGNLFALAGNYASAKDVKVGDTYTALNSKKIKGAPLTYRVDRKEKMGDADVIVLVGNGKGANGEAIEATHYLSADKRTLRKSVMKITGVDFGGVTGDLTATATLRDAS